MTSNDAIEVTEILQAGDLFLKNFDKDDEANEVSLHDCIKRLSQIDTTQLSHVQFNLYTRISQELQALKANLQIRDDASDLSEPS